MFNASDISVSKEYSNYKRSLDLNVKGNKRMETLVNKAKCFHCKSTINPDEECLVLRDKKGKIIKVFCKECVLNTLRLYKTAIAMENLPYDDDMEEIKRTDDLIELVKLYLNPVQRRDLNVQEETSEYHATVISLDDYDNDSSKWWRRKGIRRSI